MIEVKLTKQELIIGASVGCIRRIESIFGNYYKPLQFLNEKEAWGADIEAACAELAFLKLSNYIGIIQ